MKNLATLLSSAPIFWRGPPEKLFNFYNVLFCPLGCTVVWQNCDFLSDNILCRENKSSSNKGKTGKNGSEKNSVPTSYGNPI
jgi:hypothetical protein